MFRRLLRIAPLSLDFGLLVLRVASAGVMLTHGWPKVANFNERFHAFGDPYGLGSEITFLFAVLAEFVCAILLGLGLFTRYALIPLIITMATVVFVVHADDPFARKEVPSLLLTCFVTLFFVGPGRYAFDARMR
ncbi:MAG TPA: DoxX family protein [Cyclobacteriaceae bacterium]|jgi:putative oxidoreductase